MTDSIIIYCYYFYCLNDFSVCSCLFPSLALSFTFITSRGFFPVVVGFIRRIPVLGSILNLPFISAVSTAATLQLCFVYTQHGYISCLLITLFTHHIRLKERPKMKIQSLYALTPSCLKILSPQNIVGLHSKTLHHSPKQLKKT